MFQTPNVPALPAQEKIESGKSALEALKGLSIDDAISHMANGIVQFSFKLVIAVLIFYIGKFIIKRSTG